MNFKRNKKYFQGKKKGWPVFMIIIAGLLSLFALFVFSQVWNTCYWYIPIFILLFSQLLIHGAIVILIVESIKVMRDTAYDEMIEKELIDFQSEALYNLEIPKTGLFVEGATVIEGYCYGDNVVAVKKGKDGLFRTNLYEKTLLVFAKDWMWVYATCIDTLTGSKNNRVKFYRYEDIISVCSDIENGKAVFRIISGNDNCFRCNVKSSEFSCQVAARVQNIINKRSA
ncbi:MAG: hypothetical protein E7388_01435 [Ruminococcaceae bacterium]|nr:hypothetical protein [Oscillospiraceae bacterium]